MPCYSRILTKMNNADNLEAALKALGYTVNRNKTDYFMSAHNGTSAIEFTRSDLSAAFAARGDTAGLSAIGKKYAEVGVRNWASKRGFNITENDGTQMTLVNRRTF